jgi:hypothetical protein
MSDLKLTPWFPGDVKPVRIGVYERKWPYGGRVWTIWNWRNWGHSHFTNTNVRYVGLGRSQSIPWRGLASKDGK